jgi:hypothetical protein
MTKRVRTGCATCRARKVKCDLSKPRCLRCSKAKLLCLGYGITVATAPEKVSDVSSGPLRPKSDDTVFYRTLIRLESLRDADCYAFDFCRRYTVQDLSSRNKFWTSSVMACAEQSPAVLHGLLALAAAHRAKLSSVNARGHQHFGNSGSFGDAHPALPHYYIAVSVLRNSLSTEAACDKQVVLVACLILICCDLLMGRYAEASIHLQNGLKVIAPSNGNHSLPEEGKAPVTLSSTPSTVMDDLCYEFATLDIQSANFGNLQTRFVLKDSASVSDGIYVPALFSELDDAWRVLMLVHSRLNRLALAHTRAFVSGDSGTGSTTSGSVEEQGCLINTLDRWEKSFHDSPLRLVHASMPTPLQKFSRRRYASSRLLHAFLTVGARMVFSLGDEMASDCLMREYLIMTKMCEELVSLQPSVTLDIGVIQPCFILGSYCRHPSLRRRCIDVLHKAGIEGHWDARLIRQTILYKMEREEAEAGYLHEAEQKQLPFTPEAVTKRIPAHARYTYAFAFFQPGYQSVELHLQRKALPGHGQENVMDGFEIVRKTIKWPPTG